MAKIKHNYFESNPIIHILFPRFKQYRFRFLNPQILCTFAIIYMPLLSCSTLFWIILTTPLIIFIYYNNSFFIDRFGQLLFKTNNVNETVSNTTTSYQQDDSTSDSDDKEEYDESDCTDEHSFSYNLDRYNSIFPIQSKFVNFNRSKSRHFKHLWFFFKRFASYHSCCRHNHQSCYDINQSNLNKKPLFNFNIHNRSTKLQSWKLKKQQIQQCQVQRAFPNPDLSSTYFNKDSRLIISTAILAPFGNEYVKAFKTNLCPRKSKMNRLKKIKKEVQSMFNGRNNNSSLYSRKPKIVQVLNDCNNNNNDTTEIGEISVEDTISEPLTIIQHDVSKENYNRKKQSLKNRAESIEEAITMKTSATLTKTTKTPTNDITLNSNKDIVNNIVEVMDGCNSIMTSIQPMPQEVSLNEIQNYDEVKRIQKLFQYPFFQVDIHLKYGENLLARDSCGTSDPYVKFTIGNKVIYKSHTIFKTLNPTWDEYFVLPIENICKPIMVKVYDYDHFFLDDYLGTTNIDLTKLEPGVTTGLELCLYDDSIKNDELKKKKSCGKIFLTIRLNPKTQEEREYYYGRGKWTTITAIDSYSNKKIKLQPYDSIVLVVLVKGDNIKIDQDYYIRLKMGAERFKSKTVSKSVHSPYWAEEFEMHLYADQSKVLEIAMGLVQNQNDFVDKFCIDLSELETERTHKFVHILNCSSRTISTPLTTSTLTTETTTTTIKHASIEMLVTITGTQPNLSLQHESSVDDSIDPIYHSNSTLLNYYISNLYDNFFNVGTLIVKVHKAENLSSADINGKSDPFCVLELVNERLRTNTEYKTLSPEWNKSFKFKIKDIHDVLEVTIYDEDKDRVEFLGKVAIPLLKIKNGEKRWYALKDKKLQHQVKGHIFLECWISYNMLKASILTFTPRPKKYFQEEIKFKKTLFIRNVIRLKNICMEFMEVGQFLHSCIQWESPSRSLFAFITFLISVYYFEFYMLPLVFVLFILMNYLKINIRSHFHPTSKDSNEIDFIDETMFDEDFYDKVKEKKSLKKRLQTMQKISTLIMIIIDKIASYIERIKNTTNFTVPYLSWLAVIGMSITTVVFYYVPIRYLILIWGINKFTKKFRAPDSINNNEIIDFLSRVPDMKEKMMYKEFKPTIVLNQIEESPLNNNLDRLIQQ